MSRNFLKISNNIFNNSKIKFIENMEKGDTYLTLWFKLLVEASNSKHGYLTVGNNIPHTVSTLSVALGRSPQLIKESLDLFLNLNMIEKEIDNSYKIRNWDKYQTEEFSSKDNKIPYDEIKELYNSICTNLSPIKKLSSARKNSIKKIFNKYKDINIFEKVFKKANENSFLTGNNKNGWKANFDWLVNETNLLKVLEDRYVSFNNNNSSKYNNNLSVLQNAYNNAKNEEINFF